MKYIKWKVENFEISSAETDNFYESRYIQKISKYNGYKLLRIENYHIIYIFNYHKK